MFNVAGRTWQVEHYKNPALFRGTGFLYNHSLLSLAQKRITRGYVSSRFAMSELKRQCLREILASRNRLSSLG